MTSTSSRTFSRVLLLLATTLVLVSAQKQQSPRKQGVPSDCRCTNLAPPGNQKCDEYEVLGMCARDWMVAGSYCAYSCGRCLCPQFGVNCQCDDHVPKDREFESCEEVVDKKMCLDEEIIQGGFCATSCGRCECGTKSVAEWAGEIQAKLMNMTITVQEASKLLDMVNELVSAGEQDRDQMLKLFNEMMNGEEAGEEAQETSTPQTEPSDMFWAYRMAKSDELDDTCGVMEVLRSEPQFSYMEAAVRRTGMDLVLEHTSTPHTMFIPENKVFVMLADKMGISVDDILEMNIMRKIVGYHIVEKIAYDRQGLQEVAVASTLVPEFPLFIDISGELNLIEGVAGSRANVIRFDIPACHAIVHVIDGLMSPDGPIDKVLSKYFEENPPEQPLIPSPSPPPQSPSPDQEAQVYKNYREGAGSSQFEMIGDPLPPIEDGKDCADVTGLQLLMSHPRLDHVPRAMMMFELAHTVLADNSRPMTIFVPEEEAFLLKLQQIAAIQPMDMITARNLILYHIIPDELLSAADLTKDMRIKTQSNLTIQITGGKPASISSVGNEVNVLEADLGNACNVKVHIISDIMLPFELLDDEQDALLQFENSQTNDEEDESNGTCFQQSALQVLRTHPNLNSIEPSLVFAGVEDLYASEEVTMTVFIPHDDAFSAVVDRMLDDDNEDYGGIFDPFNRHYLKSILLYHIIPNRLVNETLLVPGESYETLLTDAEITIQSSPDGTLQVAGIGKRANILDTNVGSACNMVVHVIDDILLPINPTLTGDASMDYGLMLRASLEENDLSFQNEVLKHGCDPTITAMDVMRRDPLLNTMSLAVTESQQEATLDRLDKEATVFLPDNEGGWRLLSTILSSGMPDDLLSPSNRVFWGSLFLYHVIPDIKLTAEQLLNSTDQQFQTMFNGIPVTVVSVGEGRQAVQGVGNTASIIAMDVSVSCKVAVHVVDAVLLPFTVQGLDATQVPEPIPNPTSDQRAPQGAPLEVEQITTEQKIGEDNILEINDIGTQNGPKITCKTLAQVMESDDNISIISLFMREAGLEDILDSQEAGVTIIAPQNSMLVNTFDFFQVLEMSLARDSPEAQQFFSTMKFHIIQGAISVEELVAAGVVSTMAMSPTGDVMTIQVTQSVDPDTDEPVVTLEGPYGEAVLLGEPITTACGSVILPVDKLLTLEPTQVNEENQKTPTPPVLQQKNFDSDCIPIMNVISGHPKLGRFADMLKRAGMASALTRGTNITVFAPEDEGLSIILEALGNHVDMLEMEGLQAWMGYHVVHGVYYEEDLFPGMILPTYTMSDKQTPLEIEVQAILGGEGDGLLMKSVGSDARTAEPDLFACGGVVHIMDVPLMPVAATEASKKRK